MSIFYLIKYHYLPFSLTEWEKSHGPAADPRVLWIWSGSSGEKGERGEGARGSRWPLLLGFPPSIWLSRALGGSGERESARVGKGEGRSDRRSRGLLWKGRTASKEERYAAAAFIVSFSFQCLSLSPFQGLDGTRGLLMSSKFISLFYFCDEYPTALTRLNVGP